MSDMWTRTKKPKAPPAEEPDPKPSLPEGVEAYLVIFRGSGKELQIATATDLVDVWLKAVELADSLEKSLMLIKVKEGSTVINAMEIAAVILLPRS